MMIDTKFDLNVQDNIDKLTKFYTHAHTHFNKSKCSGSALLLCYNSFHVLMTTENNFAMGMPKMYGSRVPNGLSTLWCVHDNCIHFFKRNHQHKPMHFYSEANHSAH